MIDKHSYRVHGAFSTILAITLLAVLISPTAAARQSQAPLQITVPTSGAIVSPGQTLSVTVGSPAGLTFAQVDVIAESPIGLTTSATSLPAQFSVTIPSNIACGPRMLTAEGTTTSGQNVQSASIVIDVERTDFPSSLTPSTSARTLESQGQQVSFGVFAMYSDGTVLRVTESSYVTYASSNNAVATVNSTGVVTAVASGDASITATYTLGSLTNQVPIPVSVQLPMLTASPSSLTFPSQGVGTASSSQQVTLSNASGGTVSVLSVAATSDFSETDNCVASSPLGASGSCAVNVTFSPTATGTRTGNLVIGNSANIASLSIALTGAGSTAPPTPNIASLSPTSGPVGTSVTITGTNFGATQSTSTVTFNGTTAAPTSWSATSIVTPVPTGATTGNVVVTVGGVASNGVSFTLPPSITTLSPSSGAVGTSVTIAGANFGTTQGTSTVTFNGTTATPTSWSNTSIAVPVPMGATTGNVVVTVGGVASNGVSFTVSSIAFVQGSSASQSSSQTVAASFSSQQGAGDLNVVVVACSDATATPCGVTSVNDTKGNTYALAVGPTTATSGMILTKSIYYARSIVSSAASANTVTVTFKKTIGGGAELRIAEYKGLSTTSPLDVSVAGYWAGQTSIPSLDSGGVTTTNPHDLLLGAGTTNYSITGPGAHYTSRIITSFSSILEDQETTITGRYGADAPLGSGNGTILWVMQMVAFRAAN